MPEIIILNKTEHSCGNFGGLITHKKLNKNNPKGNPKEEKVGKLGSATGKKLHSNSIPRMASTILSVIFMTK